MALAKELTQMSLPAGDPLSDSLNRLFRPRHIAVIGASRTPGKLGHTVMRNLVRGGYTGRVSAINAVGVEVEGRPGYRSLAKVPARPDCAFIALPPAAVEEAVRDCVEAGIRFAIIGSGGFAGSELGAQREAAVMQIAKSGGLRVLGPDADGIFDVAARLSLGYNASQADIFDPGVISIVSQSGGLFDGLARRLRQMGAGLSKFAAVGNEADLTLLDFLEYLLTDDTTQVIGLIVEALSGAQRFRQLARRAHAAGKSIVVLKVGMSPRGVQAVFAHSGRTPGSPHAYQALFAESGIACVPTVEALAGSCALLAAHGRSPASFSSGLLCVTTSGAGGAIVADSAGARGVPMAGDEHGRWETPLAEELAGIPGAAALGNPIDIGSLEDWNLLPQIFNTLGRHGASGPLVAYSHVPPGPGMAEQLANALSRRRRAIASPVAVVTPGGLSEAVEAIYARSNILLFHDTAACFDSLQCYYASVHAQAEAAHPLNAAVPRPRSEVLALLEDARVRSDSELLRPADAAALLAQAGVTIEGAGETRLAQQSPAAARLVVGFRSEGPLGSFIFLRPSTGWGTPEQTETLLPVPFVIAALPERLHATPLGRLLGDFDAGEKRHGEEKRRGSVAELCSLIAALLGVAIDYGDQIESVELAVVVRDSGECTGTAAQVTMRKSPHAATRHETGAPILPASPA